MDVRIWRLKAERFREAAISELKNGRYDVASFSAQQAAELYLKGFIIGRTGSKPYTHLLTELLKLIFELTGKRNEGVERCAASLEVHYLQARYPDSRLRDYTREEAEEAVRCMEVILDFVRSVEDNNEEGQD